MSAMVESQGMSDEAGVIVPLTQGHVALVDPKDADVIKRHRWTTHRNTGGKLYALSRKHEGAKVTRLLMHRLIMRPGEFQVIDHINGNTLDNRRANLRIADAQTNGANMHASWGSSNYKGVYFDVRLQKWAAVLRKDGQKVHLGVFSEEDDAAIAYDRAAMLHFGEHARTNAPRKLYRQLDALTETKRSL